MSDKNILLKVHKSYRNIIAICDKELYGQKITEGIKQLDLTGDFFKGTPMSEDEAKEEIIDQSKEDATFNIIGEKSIRIAKDSGIIIKEGILKIKGIPFALVLL